MSCYGQYTGIEKLVHLLISPYGCFARSISSVLCTILPRAPSFYAGGTHGFSRAHAARQAACV
ncbi:MAG: hypothetical protein ACRDHZ_02370 [Ktedonobacteraceae bacterium]